MKKKELTESNIFGKQLRLLRLQQKESSQEAFADRIGLSFRALSDLELGKTLPSYNTIRKLREEFNVDINSILDETTKELNTNEDQDK